MLATELDLVRLGLIPRNFKNFKPKLSFLGNITKMITRVIDENDNPTYHIRIFSEIDLYDNDYLPEKF